MKYNGIEMGLLAQVSECCIDHISVKLVLHRKVTAVVCIHLCRCNVMN